MNTSYADAELQQKIDDAIKDDPATSGKVSNFGKAYDAAWIKIDDDIFNNARL